MLARKSANGTPSAGVARAANRFRGRAARPSVQVVRIELLAATRLGGGRTTPPPPHFVNSSRKVRDARKEFIGLRHQRRHRGIIENEETR